MSTIKPTLAERIISQASDHIITTGGGTYKHWCVGTATDPKQHFTLLGLDPNSYPKSFDCENEDTAEYVVKYFLAKGCQSDVEESDVPGRYFYIYRLPESRARRAAI